MVDSTCEHCGKAFQSPRGRRFCGKACDSAWKRASEHRTCSEPDCTGKIRAKSKCAAHYMQERYAVTGFETVTMQCTLCGADCQKYKYQNPDRRRPFCSTYCRDVWFIGYHEENAASWQRKRRWSPPRLLEWTPPACPIVHTTCVACGAAICSSAWSTKAYCSTRCQRARINRRRQQAKSRRKADARKRIFERDGYICWLCGTPTSPAWSPGDILSPTIDHLTPRSLGGGDEDSNLATAHMLCNARRGATGTTTLRDPRAA